MCRFLIAKSRENFKPQEILTSFSRMAQKSRAFDGDRQEDGWGMSWWGNGTWEQYVSIKPIWYDTHMFSYAPQTKYFAVHARSASFTNHKNTIAYNQPFIYQKYAFVFNGLLKGVTLPYPLEGTIGSQKIFSLLRTFLSKMPPKKALVETVKIITTHTRHVQALNMGLCDGSKIYAYTHYSKYPQYYHLQHAYAGKIHIVSSEAIEHFDFSLLPKESVYVR
ncbi:MAG: class II glutamine amidotransferase [Candidatus Roizmanbacteria bacterium]|nr:class II glutamine amidotransferase [Candidatus Roizmanbacteria bacterium]